MVTLSGITAYEIDKIQNEAARIANEATKLSPLTNLCKEIGLETLSKKAKLLKMNSSL